MTLPAYEGLARAFVAEGVEMMFALMGDANMHFVYALSRHNNVRIIHTRHEHCACAAAMSYSLATGQLGVTSVTCGPGFTQTMTALTTAVQARVPLLIFAGEAPIGARFHNQRIDQPPFAAAAGARYIQAHSAARMFDQVREATARRQQPDRCTERASVSWSRPSANSSLSTTIDGGGARVSGYFAKAAQGRTRRRFAIAPGGLSEKNKEGRSRPVP